jgi:hypothetical protein
MPASPVSHVETAAATQSCGLGSLNSGSVAHMGVCAQLLALIVVVLFLGCGRQEPRRMGEKEFLERYHDVPMTPEGISKMIDDRNKIEGRKDTTDYSFEYSRSTSDGTITLLILRALDQGDVARAKQMLISRLNAGVGFLPEYGKSAKLTSEQVNDARKFAKDYLDYLASHTNEISPKRLDFQMGFLGLAQLLQDEPQELAQLKSVVQAMSVTNGTGRPLQ